MIFIENMKNFKIYRTKTFLPTVDGNKKKGSAVLLFTPNYESSNRIMNNDIFINKLRYSSYYIERDISYYINSKIVEELDESAILNEQAELAVCLETKRSELKDEDFGVPSKRKFPLDTEQHVRSAIKFFNYVDPEDEEELARRIIAAMKKYDIYGKVNVSEKNRFSKYYHVEKAVKESVLPIYHNLYGELDIYYNMWSNGTLTEEAAKSRIERLFKNNLIDCPVPTPEEYYKSKGVLYTESTNIETSHMLKYLPEDTINTGDKVLFFNESTANDNRLKVLLYRSRIRYRKDLMGLYEKVKSDNAWIKYVYPDIRKYMSRNIFIDLYFYNSVFFENNTWVFKRGMTLYLDFMSRLINHPNLKNGGYSKKTIFIPVIDWDKYRDASVWNLKKSVNPISCLYQLMFEGKYNEIKKLFGDTNIIFVGNGNYFKVNFSQIDNKDFKKYASKLRLFCSKICKNEDFDAEDEDTTADNVQSSEVIKTNIADTIELKKGVDITPQLYSIKKKQELSKANKAALVKANIDINKNAMVKTANPANNITSQSIDNKKLIAKAEEEKVKEKLAANLTKTYMTADDDNYDADQDQKNADLEKLSAAIDAAANDNTSEEDAMDALDNDEIKAIIANLGNDDEVKISDSRASRMTSLDQKMLEKQVKGKTIKEIIDDNSNKEEVVTKVDVASPNKEEWSNLKYVNFDKNYNIDKDIINIFRHFNSCSRPIVIRDINVSDNSTSEDRLMLYDVDMEDYRGKRFRIKLDIPIMEDNRFLLRGNYKSVQTQFFNMPIIKTDIGTCQLISNYKKIFLYRFGDNNGKTLPAVSKFIKAANKYKGNKIKFTYGDNTKVCTRYNLPIDYIDLAGTFTTIETDKWIVYFNQNEIREKYTIETGKGFPFAYNKKMNAIEYFPPEIVDTFIDMLCENIFEVCPEFKDNFDAASRTNVCAYSRASIMSSKIPLVILCAYHIGLTATMQRAGIKYQIVDKLTKEMKLDTKLDWIEFSNGYLVYEVNYESSLLMNGLKPNSTNIYEIGEMDNKGMYLSFLDNYGGRIKADGLDNFRDLFVDPMIKESLEYYKLPTDYIDILLYGNAMLNDNKFVPHTDASSRKLRRYQLIAVYAYLVLSDAYGKYSNMCKHGGNAQFTVKQSAIIDYFLTDSITSDDSCINALRDVETTNAITTKGPSGMNADRAYSLDKRLYNDSMLNVLGMSTGFAGNVGITRQTTINSNVTADGYVKAGDGSTDNMNDANTLTATEAMIPFGSTRDDPMRTAMSFIQTSKHMVRTEDSDPLLVTNGADEVMPYLTTDKFAFKTKDNGTIKEVTDSYILVEYSNGKKDYISLDQTIEKNSDGGYFVPLKLDADPKLKPGMKFKKDQILAYDKYSFSNKLGESDNLAYNIGKLAKVAILNSDEGFEDSGIISASMANKLATRVDIKFDVVIDKDSTILKIAKVGDHIEASDSLIEWDSAFDDEDSENVMSALRDNEEISEFSRRKLISDITGTITSIKMYRTVELDDMTPSLRKVVSTYEKPLKEKAKVISDNELSKSLVPAHYVLAPTGKLKRAQDAVLIEFYVEYMDTVGVGDKVVYNSANKAVEKGIFPVGKEPYTAFRPEEKIDALVGDTSISKRLVTSSFVYGSLQKLMIELDRSVKDILGIEYDHTTV